MKVALGADHRGHKGRQILRQMLTTHGHEVKDFGPAEAVTVDYPDIGFPVACSVRDGQTDAGILLCGSGIGMSIVANKVKGVRAALCHDEVTAEMSRRHNNSNVLCLPADLISEDLMCRVVEVWLSTEFEGGRHEPRVKKIMDYEEGKS